MQLMQLLIIEWFVVHQVSISQIFPIDFLVGDWVFDY